ncbi:MAG TPA: DUF1003 domain-containing protein [Solirubrobacteraceae bacterium]|nr:DUF1003 domain-containing protein [Solirubrobacteraceae bacterium]
MARRDDLSTPRGASGGPSYDPDSFARFAERVARFFGTGRYLAVQTGIVVIWIAMNAVAWSLRWDKYPFILLNLVFSTQAAYAAPLILLAQNRQADRDKAEAERDREINARSLADTEFIAREMAAIRLALEHKADRDDLAEPLERLTTVLERIHGVELSTGLEPPSLGTSGDDDEDDADSGTS